MAYRLLVPNPAIPLLHDYVGGGTPVGDVVTASLIDALDRLHTRFGSSNPSDWRQKVAVIKWTQLGIGRAPDTIWMNRGTYNQLVHLGKGRQRFAFNVVDPGRAVFSGVPIWPINSLSTPRGSTSQCGWVPTICMDTSSRASHCTRTD